MVRKRAAHITLLTTLCVFAAQGAGVERVTLAQNETMKSAPSAAPATNAPAPKLGAKQDPVACDCTNCSAEHCQPKPLPGGTKYHGITLKRGIVN